MQALVLYFIRKYKGELDKYAQTFMKKLVDENILSEKFVIDWFDKAIRLDKDSKIYDKKAEKKFRDLIEKFVEWLKVASSDSGESSSDDEEEAKETKEAPEEEEPVEDSLTPAKSEAQLRAEAKQKEQIEKMKAQQAEALARQKAKNAEEEEKQAAAAEAMGNNREQRIDLGALQNNDDVDVDDI